MQPQHGWKHTKWKRQIFAPLMASAFALAAAPASAQLLNTTSSGSGPNPGPTTARLIEWDLPAQADAQPGAMMVDLTGGSDSSGSGGSGSSIWFVTRVLSPTVYRMDIKSGPKKNYADWTSWQLDPDFSGVAGGLKKLRTSKDKDKRYIFVRTAVSLQRIDTLSCGPMADFPSKVACDRVTYVDGDGGSLISDVAVDDRRYVYSTIAIDPLDPLTSVVQRIDGTAITTQKAVRWTVGGGAGTCATSGNGALPNDPCLSGIDIDPRDHNVVYYSEPASNNIGELNTTNGYVRRWSLDTLSTMAGDSIFQPRQLRIDNDGIVWVVTGSGHLVSLDPHKNRMTKHLMPEGAAADPWGIAPDSGVVGYTADDAFTNAVAMLLPKKQNFTVYPVPGTAPRTPLDVLARPGKAQRVSGHVYPNEKTVVARVTPTNDGTFIEAFLDQGNDSMTPLGITPDRSGPVGTFFYAVGNTPMDLVTNRVGRVRLPRHNVRAKHERDDDDNDDDGKRGDMDDDVDDDGIVNMWDHDSDNDGAPDGVDDDDDDDGIPNQWDGKNTKESMTTFDEEASTPAGGATDEVVTAAPGTLLLVASTVSTNLLGNVAIDIIDPTGKVVASSLPTAGAALATWVPTVAGDYIVRVKNLGLTPVTLSTRTITREAWLF